VPEWYLVFNPKEYADYLVSGKNPSDFPFYASIDEYWTLYDRSMKLVSAAYSENEEYKTMLNVIGVSITMEYTAKLLYENSVGRIFSWFSNGVQSDQEKMIASAYRAYSDFIYDKAWYEFEFMPWIKRVWSVSNTAESNWFRKIERTLFFTLEFSFKACYAKLIEWGAKATYKDPVTNIYLLVSNETSVDEATEYDILYRKDKDALISIPRWGAFTKNVLQIAETNVAVREIGGNDQIVVSIITDQNVTSDFKDAEILYESLLVTDPARERQVYLLPVARLLNFIRDAKSKGAEVEHVFDY
jgi:hypothetical protein